VAGRDYIQIYIRKDAYTYRQAGLGLTRPPAWASNSEEGSSMEGGGLDLLLMRLVTGSLGGPLWVNVAVKCTAGGFATRFWAAV